MVSRKIAGRAIGVRRSGTIPSLVACAFLLTLSCRKWDNRYDAIGDHPPSVPSLPSPADAGFSVDSGLVLSWQSQDPDSGDTAYFNIYFDTVSPPRLLDSNRTQTSFAPGSVAAAGRYYWQVVAYDNHSDTAAGPVWQFQVVPALRVISPDSGARLRMYSLDTITWTGGPSADRRASAGLDSTLVYYSTDDGMTWLRQGRALSADRFFWQVPPPATESARVKVCVFASGDSLTGTSGRFAIADTLGP